MSESLPTLSLTEAASASVREFPERTRPFVLQLAFSADECPSWWTPSRDVYLSKFWPTEPFLAGAIYSVASRNAAFRYELTGPRDQVEWAQQLLAQADFGAGWQPFLMKVSQEILTADNGAFIEIIRPAKARTPTKCYDAVKSRDSTNGEPLWYAFDRDTGEFHSQYELDFKVTDSPLDLPVGLAHLDSQRCSRTGDPEYPVIYTDLHGVPHRLAWYQVVTIEESPSPREQMNGVGICATSRAFRLAQVLRDLTVYKHEKVSGRFAKAIHLTNIDAEAIQDAITQAEENADNRGLLRYMQPIIAATLDPNAIPSIATLELATLPDGFDEETTMRWYIAGLALAFGVDYGFLAPLPGSKLGTAAQAETAERQARGKSSRLFMQTLEFKLNYSGVLPQSVSFKFAVVDPWEESERDRALARRARSLSTLIQAEIITPAIARQMLADWRDLDPAYLGLIGESDVSPFVTVSGTELLREPEEITIPEQITITGGGNGAGGEMEE